MVVGADGETGCMRVLLKFELDCSADVAWRAIRSPAGLKQVSAPFMKFHSEQGGFPDVWPAGEHLVHVELFGLVSMGRQVIAISYPHRVGDTRFVRDSGYGISGMFTVSNGWQHTMAVTPLNSGRTLYRDELRFEAGALTPLMWPAYWAFWQWRALRMRTLSRGWK